MTHIWHRLLTFLYANAICFVFIGCWDPDYECDLNFTNKSGHSVAIYLNQDTLSIVSECSTSVPMFEYSGKKSEVEMSIRKMYGDSVIYIFDSAYKKVYYAKENDGPYDFSGNKYVYKKHQTYPIFTEVKYTITKDDYNVELRASTK